MKKLDQFEVEACAKQEKHWYVTGLLLTYRKVIYTWEDYAIIKRTARHIGTHGYTSKKWFIVTWPIRRRLNELNLHEDGHEVYRMRKTQRF